MPRVKLTDALIASSLPQDKVYDLNDTETPGLQCVINPKGKKTFKFRVQNVQKKIGVFPIMKCAEARKITLVWHGELIRGDKPGKKEEKPEIKDITLDGLIKEYLEYKESGKDALEKSTLYDYHWTWKKYISPALGHKLVSQLTDVDVNTYFASLKKTYSHVKTSRIIMKPALAYGEGMGYQIAPLRPDKWFKFKTNKKERYFTSGEMKMLRDIIQKAQRDQVSRETRHSLFVILQLVMYTGCRCGEILKIRWEDVFLEEGYIQLWKTKTKKGRIVPIVPPIDELLLKMPRIKDVPYVFASNRKLNQPIAYTTLITLWLDLMKKGTFNNRDIERLTIHSLRHTFITAADRAGIPSWTIKTLVGHSLGNCVTGEVYIHHNLNSLKEAHQKIIATLNEGNY
jgi:integrase